MKTISKLEWKGLFLMDGLSIWTEGKLKSLLKIVCFILMTYIVFFKNTVAGSSGLSAPWVGVDLKNMPCEGRYMNYGPYDYTNYEHRTNSLPIVEEYHFGKKIQQLQPPETGGTIAGGIMYTLTAFPNHLVALKTLINYQSLYQHLDYLKEREKKPVSPAVECYFLRAINFSPKDTAVRILFALYLKKIEQFELADKYYQQVIAMAPEQLRFRYLYGLFLVKLKKYEQAKEQAEIIYKENYSNQKLKKALIAAGYWK